MTQALLDEQTKAKTALEDFLAGRPVSDNWYFYVLKQHAAGKHETSLHLCPACSA